MFFTIWQVENSGDFFLHIHTPSPKNGKNPEFWTIFFFEYIISITKIQKLKKLREICSDQTLAHPLNCRGGVVARLSA